MNEYSVPFIVWKTQIINMVVAFANLFCIFPAYHSSQAFPHGWREIAVTKPDLFFPEIEKMLLLQRCWSDWEKL